MSGMKSSTRLSEPSPRPPHPPKLSRRERHRAETRARIVRAALALFARHGFASTRVEQITEAADVGKGTFFNYFPTKEHVLAGFAGRQIGKIQAALDEARQGAEPLRAVLFRLLLALENEPGQNPELTRSLLVALLSSAAVRDLANPHLRQGRQLLAEIFRLGQERGEIRAGANPLESGALLPVKRLRHHVPLVAPSLAPANRLAAFDVRTGLVGLRALGRDGAGPKEGAGRRPGRETPGTQGQGDAPVKVKKEFIIGFVALLFVLLAVFFLVRSGSARPGVIHLSGNIEVTSAEVSFKIPGRVVERAVDEGDLVKAGQLTARLESTDLVQEVALRQADAENAQAALDELRAGFRREDVAQGEAAAQQAQARLDEMLAGSRPQEIAAAQATVDRAKAETERAQADAARYQALVKKDEVSQQQYDAVRTTYETAVARQKEAEEQFKLVKEGPRREQIEQARAALLQARERFRLLRNGSRRKTSSRPAPASP